ncbi:MAG TPA: response regulator, partial [Candidatus Eisenbacteria bacterium]|nr:response regulator [Candidatus Eisenbacteria bacterium]
RADAFDLLITDNTMPRMTGLALTQEILKLRPRLPVLLVSGIAERLEPDELRAKGVTHTLRKPHTSLELDEAIREATLR